MTTHSPTPSPVWRPIRWYLISGGLLILLILLIIQYNKQRQTSGDLNTSLEQQVQTLTSALAQREALLMERESQLSGYKDYESLIQSSRIREALYKQLPLTAGDQVFILPDSVAGVINGVTVTGNALEYSIRYNVRKEDGTVEDLPYTNLKKVGGE